MATKETKSPIKDLPVRQAGQAIRERLTSLFEDDLMYYFIAMACCWAMMLIKWAEHFSTPAGPRLYTGLFIISAGVFVIKFRRVLGEVRSLRLGLLGEEAVGQYLEEKLRPLGCQVLHDIPFDGFNIDHVVIGRGGIYCIETKTHSKPAKGYSEIKYDGACVTVNGFKPDRDPIVQAKAAAHSLHELLDSSTGKKFSVKPVVLYAGWFIKGPTDADVWVLNEKALPTFIGKAKETLPPEDINLITYHLKRYVIARGKERK